MIREAKTEDLNTLACLALKLWPGHGWEDLRGELETILVKTDAAFFLAEQDGAAVGFAQCQLRYDYVEGTESSPVGYLEGIFVEEDFRSRGVAKALLSACESWARAMGCGEFASDCELTNDTSLAFHLALGFEEANRIICFTKRL